MVIASPSDGPVSLEPVSISIEKPFDRRVDIADLFQARLDVPFQDTELVTPPEKGILSVGEDPSGAPRIIFAPQILLPILGLCALALLPVGIKAVTGRKGI